MALFLLTTAFNFTSGLALDSQSLPFPPFPSASASPPPTSTKAFSSWDVDPQTIFLFETIVASIVVAFIITFLLGTRKNLSIASKIAQTLNHVLSHQFVQFGTKPGKALTRDGSSYYWYFASGRRYTPGLTISMDLSKRMDIFAYTSSFMSAPQKDRLVYYLPISDDVQMDSFNVFIVKRRELARLRSATDEDGQKKIASVETMAADVADVKGISSELLVMAEHPDIATALLPEYIREILTNHVASLISIHVTDQGCDWDTQSSMAQRLIRIEFTLPFLESKHALIISDMARLSLHILDTVATSKISPAAKKRVTELRKKLESEREKREQKARAEAMATKKLDKKKKEEEAVGKMSAQKQRKYEEKKRKKELADRMRKATKK